MSQKTTAKKKPVRAPLKVIEAAPVPPPVSTPEPHFTKFTHSIDTTGREMCVIRTNDLDELYELRERLLPKIVYAPEDQPRQPKSGSRGDSKGDRPYRHEGDPCPECDGRLVRTTGVSQRTGEEYPYLICDNGDCAFTAWLSKFPKKQKKGNKKGQPQSANSDGAF